MKTRKFFASLVFLIAAPASAQVAETPTAPDLDAQRFLPTFDSRQTLWAESTGVNTGDDLEGVGRLWLNYMNAPLIWIDPIDGSVSKIISDALALNVVGAVSYNRLRLGVDVPVYLVAASGPDVNADGAGTGDIALDGRVNALDRRMAPLGLALAGRLTLPTATVATSLGSPGVTGEITLMADKQLDPIYLTANLGTRLAPGTVVNGFDLGNQFLAKLGGAYAFEGTDAGVSLDGTTNAYLGAGTNQSSGSLATPVELLAGGWYRVNDEWVVRGGAGRGLTEGVGAPAIRIVASIAYERPIEGDKDADGIMDGADACIDEPEDFDGFEDENGCPDLDNDLDGIADLDDACPLRAEDLDGFMDEDGCPDESVGVTFKAIDRRGNEVQTATLQITGPEDAAGASGMEATLHEGVYTVQANAANFETATLEFSVPQMTEVVVQFDATPGTFIVLARTPEGKPIPGATYTLDGVKGPVLENGEIETQEPSGQHTLVVRAEDYAPYKHAVFIEPNDVTEVVAILQPTKVKLTRNKIEIKDRVFFDTGKSTIKPVSFDLLNEVAQIIQDYPEIEKIRIEGHTDATGSDASNQTLSESRAASVQQYLIDQGVNPDTLTSIGYGESKPLVEGNTRAAYDKNRRVEFFVEVWNADNAPER